MFAVGREDRTPLGHLAELETVRLEAERDTV
jgi:hypothetical protein